MWMAKKKCSLKWVLLRPLLLFLIMLWVALGFFIYLPLRRIVDSKSQLAITYSLSHNMAMLNQRLEKMDNCLNSVSTIALEHAWSYMNNKSYWQRGESKRAIQAVLDEQLRWRDNECMLLDLDARKFLVGTTYLNREETEKLLAQMESVSNRKNYTFHQPIQWREETQYHLMMSVRLPVGAPRKQTQLMAVVINATPLSEILDTYYTADSEQRRMEGHVFLADADGRALRYQGAVAADEKVIRFSTETNSFGVRLMYEIPEAQYYRELHELLAWMTLIVALGGLTAVISACLIVRRIRRPIDGIINVIQEIQLGIPLSPRLLKESGIEEYDQILNHIQEADLRIKNEKERLIQAKKEKRAKDIMLLRMQINPHFLYNALNAVQWMARCNNTREVEAYMNALLYILHYNLDEDGKHLVPLEKELKLVRMYVKVHQYRYENDISCIIHGDPKLPVQIPRFILQPLVENAIYHGLKNEKGCVEVRISCEDDKLHLSVCDNGQGIKSELLEAMNEGNRHGIGVGIHYVHTIVTDCGGTLKISNIKKGDKICGTEAKITLDIIPLEASDEA